MLRAISLVFMYLTVATGLSAQESPLYFEKLTTENGLSHNKVNCIIQDRRGFIWFGTDDGLNRYDGYNFVIFRHQPGNSSTISGNIINDMIEDPQGIIWIATGDGGLSRYDYRLPPAQQFKQYNPIPGVGSVSKPANIINTLLFDSTGHLWLGTTASFVVRFDPRTEKFERPIQKGTKTILDLCMDSHGTIWAGRVGGGILKINPLDLSNTVDQRYSNLYAKLPHATVTALYMDADKNMWYGSWDKVLYRQSSSPSDSEEVFKKSAHPYSFDNDEIDCFTEDVQGHIWMGGHYSGLHVYDKQTGRFYNYRYDPSREGTIADNRINCMYTDHTGKIWLGTGKGVSIHHPLQQQFEQTFLTGKGNSEMTIYDFYKNSNGDLWVGTSEGIFVRRSIERNFTYRQVMYKNNKLSVTKFFRDVDGTFYIGTNYSFFRYDLEKNILTLLPNTEKDTVMRKIIESRVVSVIRDTIEDHPVLLVAPYGHFLAYYDLVDQRWISRTDTVKKIVERFNLQDNLIRKFYRCDHGQIWLATTTLGVGSWTHHSLPKVQQFINEPSNTGTISSNNVYDIAEDNHGNLWVTTFGGGLNYFNTTTKKFTHIPAANNLLEGVQVDKRGNVWLVSNGNLHKYDPLSKSYTSFDLPDIDKSGGIKGYIYKDSNDHLYVAGTNYFIEFDPRLIRDNRQLPDVFLTDFKIFNQSYSDMLMKDRLTLKYNQNYFTLEFAAPDFSAGRNIQYAYMLEGRDHDWVNIGSRNFEQFSNLAGGDYTFKVRATNRSGVWNKKEMAIHISIIPPFWKTWWFYAICVTLAVIIIYAIYRYRINELLKLQAIRNKIAQDLHDNVGSTLSSISVYSQVAKIYNQQSRPEDLQQTLEKISGTSSEMISEMNDIVWAINPRHDNMQTILQRMESYARPLLASQSIVFHFTFDPLIKQVTLEMTRRKNFYLIFKESVNNALKYSGCKNLWVNISLNHHYLELTVKDDGAGFDREKVRIHASQSLSGNGLRNMEMRAKEMKGTWTIESEPGKGANVFLRFPIS